MVVRSKGTSSPSLVHSLARAYHEVTSAFEREVGMTQARIVLLSHLRGAPEMSQATLQQRLAVDGAAVTRQVKQMEVEGLVARRADPSDHRFTLVTLTAQGRKLADSVLRRRETFESRITSGVATKDVVRALERIRDTVRPKPRSRRSLASDGKRAPATPEGARARGRRPA